MPTPTFAPTRQPSFTVDASWDFEVDTFTPHRGSDVTRARGVRPNRRVRLEWPSINRDERDYIVSFFLALNGKNGPFYWTPPAPMKAPSPLGDSPDLSETAGGSEGARTLYTVYTWYHSTNGETKPSAESSLAVQANFFLVADVPVIPSGVEGWRVYVGTSAGSGTLQATITDSRRWTQSGALVAGAAQPTENTLSARGEWVLIGALQESLIRSNRWSASATFLEQQSDG